MIVNASPCQLGLKRRPSNRLVGFLLVQRQIGQRIDKLARLLADDLSDFLELLDDLTRLDGRDARHTTETGLNPDKKSLGNPGLLKGRLGTEVSLMYTRLI